MLNEFKRLTNGDKVKFMYNNDDLLYGKIDGYSIFELNDIISVRKQCCIIALDERYEIPDKEYSICGLGLHIDLNKDITLCDDGYYLVHKYVKQEVSV